MQSLIDSYLHGLKVKPDELTALERDKLYGQGKPVDRIPCCLDTGETMAPLLNISLNDYYHSAEKMFELEMYLYDTFHSDGAGLSTTLRGMAEAMGSKILYFDNNIAQLGDPVLKNIEDVDQLKLVDVEKDGRLPIILEGLKMVKDALGDKVPVSASVTGPFTIAAMVMGTAPLLKATRKHPDKVKQLMEVVTENNRRYIERLLDMGVGIGFCDPVSSSSILNVKQYEEFSLPYLKKNVDYIKENGGGCGLHICGKSRILWDSFKDCGIGTFGLDNIESLAEAKEVLGPYVCIQGNVPPIDVVRLGTPQDVLRSCRDCIRDGHGSEHGYILTSGCQMPLGTPPENMTAFMDASRIFGRWPIDESLLMDDEPL